MALKEQVRTELPEDKSSVEGFQDEIIDYLFYSSSPHNFKEFQNLRKQLEKEFSRKAVDIFQIFRDKLGYKKPIIALIIFFVYSASTNLYNSALSTTKVDYLSNQILNSEEGGFITTSSLSRNEEKSIYAISEESKNYLSETKPGEPILIIPKSSKVHNVKKGENLLQISKKYSVSIKDLISANLKVDILNLKGGEILVIPEMRTKGVRDYHYDLASRGFSPSLSLSTERSFGWPTIGAMQVSSEFGRRSRDFHSGIDISNVTGTLILASKSGTVEYAGWRGSYGKCVIIDHGNGIKTLYAHASIIYVKKGQFVRRGQSIAKVGMTGNSTGPHLHFEVLVNSAPRDPLKYL